MWINFFQCNNENSNSILKKTCGECCNTFKSTNWYHFGLISIKDDINFNNEIELLSLTKCSINEFYGEKSIELSYGTQKINNFNSSYNKAFRYSGIVINSAKYHLMKYSNFFQNIVNDYIMIRYDFNLNNIDFCNFINNNSPSYGIIYINHNGILNINNSIIYNNINKLFHIDLGNIYLKFSFLEHINIGSVITSQIFTSQTKTFNLTHFQCFIFESSIELKLKQKLFQFIFLF